MAIGGNFTNSISKTGSLVTHSARSLLLPHQTITRAPELGPTPWASPSPLLSQGWRKRSSNKSQACGQRWIIQAGFKQTYTTQASATASRELLAGEVGEMRKEDHKGK